MRLDRSFMLRIFNIFEDNNSPYIPVVLLAKKIEDDKNLQSEGDDPIDKYDISNKLVFHLLHLQDLGCIENLNKELSWGYTPNSTPLDDSTNIHHLIENSLTSGEFETPHGYSAKNPESVIRLTAVGIQMKSILYSNLGEKIKDNVIEFGKLAFPQVVSTLLEGVQNFVSVNQELI